ncbi:MAG: NAD-dependent epimerase/dehydratase family protein [Patescibacteria group bacterium]
MRILVTGGAGFIGSHLVDSLIERGFKVFVIDNLSSGKKKHVPPKATFYKLDVRSPRLKALIKKINPDYICHLAAQVSVPRSQDDAAKDAEINIIGSLKLAEAARQLKIKKFVFVSTGGAIYGKTDIFPTPETAEAKPRSPYALAKYTVEKYLQYYGEVQGMPFTVARLANIYGPRQEWSIESGVVSIFINKLLTDEVLPLHWGGRQTRDFVYVGDTVRGIIKIMEQGRGIYNIGTGQETSIKELAVLLGKIVGQPPRIKHDPPRSEAELERSILDIRLIKEKLGWRPQIKLEDGLAKTVDWFKQEVI